MSSKPTMQVAPICPTDLLALPAQAPLAMSWKAELTPSKWSHSRNWTLSPTSPARACLLNLVLEAWPRPRL